MTLKNVYYQCVKQGIITLVLTEKRPKSLLSNQKAYLLNTDRKINTKLNCRKT